jgi:tRNA dimethylallyltransferase
MNQTAKRFMSSSPQPLVIVLTGATSVGKSAVANELCQIIDAEIVIADSVQVFKCLDIGSNKPTKLDQQTVPHHLLDVFDPSDEVSADIFCEKATRAIKDIISRNKTPIVVGGATMWVQWLVHGKPDAPEATTEITEQARTMLNNAETERDWYAAVEIVREYDPVRIDKLAKNDWYRLRRYLEVGLSVQRNGNSGRNTSDYEDDSDSLLDSDPLTGVRSPMLNGLDVRCFFIGEKREDLYLTIDDRCEDMLRGGLLQEVASLLQTDTLMPEHKVSKAIGYRQSLDFLLDRRQRKDGDVSAFQKFVK